MNKWKQLIKGTFLSLAALLWLAGCGGGPEVKPMTAPKVSNVYAHSNSVSTVLFSPDGKYLASGSWDNKVKIWKVTEGKGQLQSTLNGHTNWVLDLAFSPADGKLLASASADGTVKVWSWKEEKVLNTLKKHKRKVTSLAFSPDGMYLASGAEDGKVIIWKMPAGKVDQILTLKSPVKAVAYSPHGNYLAAGGSGGKGKIWNLKAKKTTSTEIEGHTATINSLAFSADGKFMASGSDDKTAKIWEIDEGYASEWTTLYGHKGAVLDVIFSPDGKLATGSRDQTARMWKVSDGTMVNLMKGHSHWVYSVAFNPDATLFATSSKKTVVLWNLVDRKSYTLIDPKASSGNS